MYVQPQTNIRLLKNVPLDNTYEHTIYFDSESAQVSYFSGLQKYSLSNYTYQRVKKGVSRVGIGADNLYDCNYMMFQNSAYGSKWFYAFVTSVEYVNNECSEITFQLDVMQTWFFNYTMDYCFVERQHSITDKIGENVIPEGLDCGEYVLNEYHELTSVLKPLAVVVAICDTTANPDGSLYGGVYGGCLLYAYNASDIDSIKARLEKYAQKPEAVVAMYMCPTVAIDETGIISGGGTQVVYSDECTHLSVEERAISNNNTLNGYHPKNKKLYTYPYNYPSITNGKEVANFRYEYFTDLKPVFKIDVPETQPIQVALRPINYKGTSNRLIQETLVLDDYPMCSWSTDAYKAWVAQNAVPILATGALGALSATINPLGAIGTVGQLTNYAVQGYQTAVTKADTMRGSISSGSVDVASGVKNFYYGRYSCSYQYARMIDNYFDVYGYAEMRLRQPNRNSRPHWNYVKTRNCTVSGSVPASDMKEICGIYDKGITFWKKGSEIGHYDLDNSVDN